MVTGTLMDEETCSEQKIPMEMAMDIKMAPLIELVADLVH